HWRASWATKAAWTGWSRPSVARPSTVRTSRPSSSSTGSTQEATGTPSTEIVHAPHTPVPQTSLAPVRPRSWRMKSRADSCRLRMSTRWPLTGMVRMLGAAACGPPGEQPDEERHDPGPQRGLRPLVGVGAHRMGGERLAGGTFVGGDDVAVGQVVGVDLGHLGTEDIDGPHQVEEEQEDRHSSDGRQRASPGETLQVDADEEGAGQPDESRERAAHPCRL